MNNTIKKLSILSVGVLVSMTGCFVSTSSSNTPTSSSSTTSSSVVESTTHSSSVVTSTSDTSVSTTPSAPISSSSSTVSDPNTDYDVRIEAETGVVAGSKLTVVECGDSSGGKYVGDINDCGQGLYFIHYAAVGGVHDVEIGYYTGAENSKHELVVNGVAQTVVYDKNTGWGTEGIASAVAKVSAEFVQGYNVITLSKKGTSSDSPEYGGWAQIDYLDIKGTGVAVDRESLVYNLEQIKVEAELGNYNCGSSCPVGMSEASNGYIVGEINAAGHGATYNLTFPESGRYALQIAYGKDVGERPIDIKFDDANYTYNLEDYDNQSWNVFNLSNTAATFDIEAGTHTLSISRAENSNWFCFDYFVLTKVANTSTTRYEAEDCVIDGTKVKTAENAKASNGLMACDMNDCGQGLHFVHYSPVAGEFTLEVGYWTGAANSKQDVYVNDVKQGSIVYDEANGWADGTIEALVETLKINLKAGYNNITIFKNGTSTDSPEYGGWVQVDYFDIKGSVEYNPNVTVDQTLSIKIEAELGNYHSGAACPVGMSEASNGFIVGDINAEGDGSDMKIRVPESGTYELRIVYGKDAGERPININLDGTNYEYSLEDYDNQAWNVFHTSNVAATLTLDADTVHSLSISRAANSNWFCFDAIVLTKVA